MPVSVSCSAYRDVNDEESLTLVSELKGSAPHFFFSV